MEGKSAEIHLSDGKIYSTRMTFAALEEMLGDGFIKAHRGCIVSAMAIHEISDMIDLVNGEKLEYARRRKNTIIESLQTSRKWIIKGFDHDGVPDTEEQYHDYYRSFDAMPFAFTDIEMVFNEECEAVDWIFRYANEALARLEKLPLEKLIALMAVNPRRIFGLGGGLHVGDQADSTVLDLDARYRVDPATFLSMGRATPFAGWEVQGRAAMTVVGGREVLETKR